MVSHSGGLFAHARTISGVFRCDSSFITAVDRKVAKPLIEGLRNETICRDDAIRSIVPRPLLSVDDAVRRALTNVPLPY